MLSDIPLSPPKPSPAGLLSDMPLRLLSDLGGTDDLELGVGAGDGVAVFDASCLGLSAGTELPLPTLANDIPELLRILARSLLTADSGVGFSCGAGLGADFNMVNLEPLGRLTLAGAGCAGEGEAAGEDERDTEVPDSLLSLLSLEDTAADEGDDVSAFSGACLAAACDRPMEMLVLAASLDGRLAAGAGAGAVTGAGVVLGDQTMTTIK